MERIAAGEDKPLYPKPLFDLQKNESRVLFPMAMTSRK